MRPVLVLHYHEIALKGRNRERFERQLIANATRVLGDRTGARVHRMSGRLVVRFTGGAGGARDGARCVRALSTVFGIANLGVGFEVRQDPEALVADTVAVVQEWLRTHPVRTFAVRAKRAGKQYPETSVEIERRCGAAIRVATGLGVDLDDPQLTVGVEIVERTAFVLLEKIAGPGGLPVGVSGRVAVLLSSGFDSPVAAWRMMKRGCEVVAVHFHSTPYTSDASIRNVREIVERLTAWHGPIVLSTVPLIALQKAVMVGAPHALRVILYRRAMVRIAERLAAREGATAIVTGESLGQVASQTLANLAAIEAVATIPILRPLIGFDKLEIIAAAECIGTAEISQRPYDDCCSLFVPAHPATATHAAVLDRIERELGLVAQALALVEAADRVVVRMAGRPDTSDTAREDLV